jgi:parallel beta-helix repeat protein
MISFNFGKGIIGFYSLNNTIYNNNISFNKEEGIFLRDDSSNNSIIGGNVSNNYIGIILDYSSNNNSVKNTRLFSNEQHAIWLAHSSGNSVIIGCDIFDNWAYGVYLSNSINNNITQCNIFNNGEGISLYESSNNIITTNRIHNNTRGIYYWYSSKNNIIDDCDLYNNGEGIHIGHSTSSNNNISNCNIIFNTEYGIYFGSFANTNNIYHNNIINNNIQAFDDSNNGNQWDNGYPSGGNYWSDYTGIDLNSTPTQDVPPSDEIGDTPYIIDSNSKDKYPLMSPIGNFTYLYEGWNLISISFIQSDTNLGNILSSIMGSYSAVQRFDSSGAIDFWKHNFTLKPDHLNDLSNLNHTMGFWINIIEPDGVLFYYPGTPPTSNQTIQLHKGWNMVGYPSLTNHNRTVGLNNLTFDTHVDAIQWFNASTKTWHFMGPDDNFIPGRGYWVHSKVDVEWEVRYN